MITVPFAGGPFGIFYKRLNPKLDDFQAVCKGSKQYRRQQVCDLKNEISYEPETIGGEGCFWNERSRDQLHVIEYMSKRVFCVWKEKKRLVEDLSRRRKESKRTMLDLGGTWIKVCSVSKGYREDVSGWGLYPYSDQRRGVYCNWMWDKTVSIVIIIGSWVNGGKKISFERRITLVYLERQDKTSFLPSARLQLYRILSL